MFRAILFSQWRESRLAVALLAGAAFAAPLVSMWRLTSDDNPLFYQRLMQAVWQWGLAYPLIALAAALIVGLGVWRPDHRTGHVYALSLPVARSRYLALRYATGLLLVGAVAVALWLGGLGASFRVDLPEALHFYPAGLAARFLLAAIVAYTLFFALGGLTRRAARWLVAGFLVLVIVTAVSNSLGLGWNPLRQLLDAVFAPAGPLGAFRGRWMLIDV